MKEIILCSAIWYKEVGSSAYSCQNVEEGIVICGFRHGNCISVMKALTNLRTVTHAEDGVGENEQGFMTNLNRFVDRKEAFKIAQKANQILDINKTKGGRLYSEDLFYLNNCTTMKENWKIGINKMTIVTDSDAGFDTASSGHSGEDAVRYYGGNLVCESIWREKDAHLIASAPELLECLKEAIESLELERNFAPKKWIDAVKSAENNKLWKTEN